MTTNEIDQRLRKVLCNVFELEESKVPEMPGQKNVAQWDSLGHLRLIMAIEDEFSLRFETSKIPDLVSLERFREEIVRVKGSLH